MDWGAIFAKRGRRADQPDHRRVRARRAGSGDPLRLHRPAQLRPGGIHGCSAHTATRSRSLKLGWPVWACILTSIVASVIFALILGIPTLRLRADYLAIVTIAAAEVRAAGVHDERRSQDVTGSANGLGGVPARASWQSIRSRRDGTASARGSFDRPRVVRSSSSRGSSSHSPRSSPGCSCAAPGDASSRASVKTRMPCARSARTSTPTRCRASSSVVSSARSRACCSCCLARSCPAYYQPSLTFFVYAILLLGGAATILGPVVGSIVFWVLLSFFSGFIARAVEPGWLPFMSQVQAGQIRFILVGVALMLIVVFRPQGILGNKKELAFVK